MLTALVAAVPLIALIGWGPWWGFVLLIVAAQAITLGEFFQITLGQESRWLRLAGVGWGLFLGVAPLAIRHFSSPATTGFPHGFQGGWLVVLALIGIFVMYLFARGRDDLEAIPAQVALTFLGACYIGLFGLHLSLMRQLPQGSGWIFLTLTTTWLTDTGGYFAGKAIGGPKLYPSVSPKKTWAGLLGGMAAAIGGAFVIRWLTLPLLGVLDCILVGVGVAFVGQIGDLCESLIKRAYQVKDSGSILPGHGGLLDRIDALLFTAPLVYYYATWFFSSP